MKANTAVKGFDQPELDETRAGVLLYPNSKILAHLRRQKTLLGIDADGHAYKLTLIPGNTILRRRDPEWDEPGPRKDYGGAR